MRAYLEVVRRSIAQQRGRWLAISLGVFVTYYVALLLFTMLRFGEVPNYVEFHDVLGNYYQILAGTPALTDAVPILLDEPWFETGFKNPHYYGIATWSYMLIPPKMLVVLLGGALLATLVVLVTATRRASCATSVARTYVTGGIGSALVGLTSATLTWVVCCASPSWVVGLAMLGMSVSLALWLEPVGKVLMLLGLLLLAGIVVQQLRLLVSAERVAT